MTRNGAEDAKTANYPEIRFFSVEGHPAYRHSDAIAGSWKAVSPEPRQDLGGRYYSLARSEQIHVPIGLVVDAMAERLPSRGPAPRLFALHDFDIPLAELERLATEGAPEYGNYVMHWYDRYDIGLKGNWRCSDLDDQAGRPLTFPAASKNLACPIRPLWSGSAGDCPAGPAARGMPYSSSAPSSGWTRCSSTAKFRWRQRMGGEPARLSPLCAVLKPGKNVIAIRVLKTKPDGGFLGKSG